MTFSASSFARLLVTSLITLGLANCTTPNEVKTLSAELAATEDGFYTQLLDAQGVFSTAIGEFIDAIRDQEAANIQARYDMNLDSARQLIAAGNTLDDSQTETLIEQIIASAQTREQSIAELDRSVEVIQAQLAEFTRLIEALQDAQQELDRFIQAPRTINVLSSATGIGFDRSLEDLLSAAGRVEAAKQAIEREFNR